MAPAWAFGCAFKGLYGQPAFPRIKNFLFIMRTPPFVFLLLLLAAAWSFSTCHLEETAPVSIHTFEALFNTGFQSSTTSVTERPDSSYFIGGNQSDFSDTRPFVLAVTKDGQLEWKGEYSEYGLGGQVIPAEDGGVFMSYNTFSLSALEFLSNGMFEDSWAGAATPIWSYPGPDHHYRSGLAASPGGLVLCGHRQVEQGNFDVYIASVRFDNSNLTPAIYGGDGLDEAFCIRPVHQGGSIVCGYTNSFGNAGQAYLIRHPGLDGTPWEKMFGGAGNDLANSVVETADHGFLLCGYTESFGSDRDIYLVKTDALGNLIWQKNFGGTGDQEGNSVTGTADGNYFICGTNRTSSDSKIYAAKITPEGDTLWTRTYGRGPINFGVQAIQTLDGGYLIAGISNSSVYLVKTDQNGRFDP
jgi:hypothetical protein